MSLNRSKWWIVGLLILGLILAGCKTATPGAGLPTSTLAQSVLWSPLPSPTAVPTPTPVPTLTPAPIQLTVLHTNDNWGETEPCG
ncbi:MAG: hypothetical protein JXM73_09260 [Anaerolineae bacterium]|nr:hypothetical protein [Anaerolineae bacterium]